MIGIRVGGHGPNSIHMQRSFLFAALVLGIATSFCSCTSSNHVVHNGIFQQRKYNNPGWFVDVPGRHQDQVGSKTATPDQPLPLAQQFDVLTPGSPADGSLLPAMDKDAPINAILPSEPVAGDAVEAGINSGGINISNASSGEDRIMRIGTVQSVSRELAETTPQDAGGVDIFALLGFIFAFLFPVAGLVLSIIGLNRTRGGGRGHGLAVAGLVISIVFLAIYGVAVLR